MESDTYKCSEISDQMEAFQHWLMSQRGVSLVALGCVTIAIVPSEIQLLPLLRRILPEPSPGGAQAFLRGARSLGPGRERDAPWNRLHGKKNIFGFD